VIEINTHARKFLVQNRVKLGWLICNIEDYLVSNNAKNAPELTEDFRNAVELKHAPSVQEATD
jgi:hypothetical protein